MSKDFFVVDPTGLNLPSDKTRLMPFINEQIGDGYADPVGFGTEKINKMIEWAGQKYGASLDDETPWNTWPPILMANGRYLTFNLSIYADSMTFMMILSDECQKLGLIMIDPSGREPFITLPNGGGLLG
ncbi:MAG: hypothetical protein AAF490_20425 [Chloroflexota bacterium]